MLFNGAKRFEAISVEGHPWNSLVIFSKSVYWSSMRSRFNFLSVYSSGGHLVQQTGWVLAILVAGHLRNIPVQLF